MLWIVVGLAGVAADTAAMPATDTGSAVVSGAEAVSEPLTMLGKLQAVRATLVAEGAKQKDRRRGWPVELQDRTDKGLSIAIEAWKVCASSAAMRFASLPESAEAVADAALGECQDWKQEARSWTTVNFVAQGTTLGAATADRIVGDATLALKQRLTAAVMKRRLAAAAPKQDVGSEPDH